MSDPVAALPPDAILVHIGPHKTGTSAIQSVLDASRLELLEHGVLFPGKPKELHHRAAKSLRRFADGWKDDPDPAPDPKVWADLAAEARASPGRVVLSSEFFAQSDEPTRRKLVDDLGADRVHILLAARNPASLAASTWQQVLRKGHPITLDEWLEKFFRRESGRMEFWSWADPARLTELWVDTVGADRVTVVVLDEADRRLLPTTLEQLLALPPGTVADKEPTDANRGLSAVEAALLREIIARLETKLTWKEYSRVMRAGLTRRLLTVRRPGPDEPKHALPPWAAKQAVSEAEQSIAGLSASGAHLVGRLEALRTDTASDATEPEITHVPIELAAEAVIGAVAGALRNRWHLDPPRRVAAPRKATLPPEVTVNATSTKQLIQVVASRVRARAGRKVTAAVRRR